MVFDHGPCPSFFALHFCSQTHHNPTTMLDINLFLEERGGEPELIRESQRRRHESVEIVDEIIALYEDWKKSR